MGGNQISIVETGVPTAPDVTALQQMQDPLVMVHKIIQRPGNKRESSLVVNSKTGLSMKQILKLQDEVIDTKKYPEGGLGLYRFEVTDQQSTAKTYWETRIGGRSGEEDGVPATPAPGGGTAPRAAAANANVPLAPETENLGNGFIFNSKFKLLTVPDGRIFQWSPDQQLPNLGITLAPQATPTATATQASTPFAMTLPNPELENIRVELARAKEENTRIRDEAKERQRQEEIKDLRESHQKQIADTTARFEALVEKLSARPTENPELAEMKRKLEDRERQDALRAEIAAKMDAITAMVRESSANKGPDPMIQILMQMMGQQAQGAQENMRLMRESANAQLATAQTSSERFLDFMQKQAESAKDSGSSMINEKFVGVLSGVMDTMLRVKETEARLAGAGSGPDWMGILEKITEKAGTAITAFTQASRAKATADAARSNAEIVRTRANAEVAVRQAEATRALAAVKAADAPATPAASTKPATSEEKRDALAAQMFPTPPAPAPIEPAPVSTQVAPAPTPPVEPASAPEAAPKKKGGKRANPLAAASIPDLRKAFNKIEDEEFFGPFFSSIAELREELTKDAEQYSPDDVAQFVIDAREYITQAVQEAGKVPLVVDMLAYGKFAYLFERMLPEAGENFWHDAEVALAAKITAERATAE